MVAKRNSQGELERLLSKGDVSWRSIIVLLILSMHPDARAFVGLPPRAPAVSLADSQLSTDVSAIRKDLELVKADVLELRVKAGKLEQSFTGFEIDFDKYRAKLPR